MKVNKVAALAAVGMLCTSVSVYSLTPTGGVRLTGNDTRPSTTRPGIGIEAIVTLPDAGATGARFTAGSTLVIEGRLGHERLPVAKSGETFVMLEVRSQSGVKAAPAPANLSIVIDRSGSMKGSRIRNAINAASAAVSRLRDGDVVSVVTFDTTTLVAVPPTSIDAQSRGRVAAGIRAITLGGDTCISCGIEEGMALLEQTPGRVSRMVVLSDGDANHGVRDVPGFRAIAQRAMNRGIPLTTIGVDVDYNEKIMAALAQDSNGRHYFVANDGDLGRVFEAEADGVTSAVASSAEVAIDLAPGVELDRVFDRSFRRAGGRITIPLGTFSDGDVKTVLLKVRVPSEVLGARAVASVDLSYRDLARSADGHAVGQLALAVTGAAGEGELDSVVNGRVQRSETAAALKDANGLFEQGRFAEARRKLESREQALRSAADVAAREAPAAKAKSVEADFQNQIAAIDGANAGFAAAPAAASEPQVFATPPGAAPPPAPVAPQATRAGKSAVKSNQQRAVDLAF
jgi:Ca-activated chloride channel homolog